MPHANTTPATSPSPMPGPARDAGTSRRLHGALTALLTPFTPDGAVDEPGYRRLVAWQLLAGIDGLVPIGTTGESPTLAPAERERLIEIAVAIAAEQPAGGRVPIVAGTGSNDTRASIAATRRAAALGADAALVVTPYYNRPDQRMIEAHFRAVADEGDLPIVVYTVPSRTGANVEADTFLRLAEHPRVIAVKEASGNIDQIAVICRDRPRDVAVLSGDDAATLAVLAMGGDGVISVAGNEIPGELAAMVGAALGGDWAAARRIHERWLPLFRANFMGAPNPVPAKAAMLAMGLIGSDTPRLPLLPLADQPRDRLTGLLRDLGLLDGGGRQPGQAPDTVDGGRARAAAHPRATARSTAGRGSRTPARPPAGAPA
jgi:4-hydroxy-tetrahydrodipicolinate synthase